MPNEDTTDSEELVTAEKLDAYDTLIHSEISCDKDWLSVDDALIESEILVKGNSDTDMDVEADSLEERSEADWL